MHQNSIRSVDLGDHDKTSMTWKNISLKEGQKVLVSIEDKNGDEAWSAEVCIHSSPSNIGQQY
jgi:hypothetical protein